MAWERFVVNMLPMASPDDKVAHAVLRAIRRIVRRVSEHSKHMSRDIGLTIPQVVCLKAIGEFTDNGVTEVTAAMVGKQIQLSPATVSRIVDRLVRAGLIARERRSKDRRKVCLSLTDAGEERYQSLPTPLQETFVNRLMDLPTEDRLELLDALERITVLMDANDLDAAPLLTPGMDVKDS